MKAKPRKKTSRHAVLPLPPLRDTNRPLPDSDSKGRPFQIRFDPDIREQIDRFAVFSSLKKDQTTESVGMSATVRQLVNDALELYEPAPWNDPEFVKWFAANRPSRKRKGRKGEL